MDRIPDAEAVAQLLRLRWNIPQDDRIDVAFENKTCAAKVCISSDTATFELRVTAEHTTDWSALVDAVDALIGQLETNGRSHREIPVGSGVKHGNHYYCVDIQKRVSSLEALADKWLEIDQKN